jgi:hypothetical protein
MGTPTAARILRASALSQQAASALEVCSAGSDPLADIQDSKNPRGAKRYSTVRARPQTFSTQSAHFGPSCTVGVGLKLGAKLTLSPSPVPRLVYEYTPHQGTADQSWSNDVMRRRTRAIPFARMRRDSAIRDLTVLPATEWPKHLRLAREILIDELAVDDDTTRALLFASFSAAHACARTINQRCRDTVDSVGRLKMRSMFARVGRCALRSPAALRRVIDSNVRSSVRHTIIDSESMEVLIDSLVAAFASDFFDGAPRPDPVITETRRRIILRCAQSTSIELSLR